MSTTILLPRLSAERGQQIRARLSQITDLSGAFERSAADELYQAPKAFPVTGGDPIAFGKLMEIREESIVLMSQLDAEPSNKFNTKFDIAFGRLLFTHFQDSQSELGVPEVWDFLTLVILPDIALRRFSVADKAGQSRITGGQRRHVFQRLWKRWKVFGEKIVLTGKLTEDDYQALLERQFFLERPEVAQVVALAIIDSPLTGDARRSQTRLLLRQLMQLSGVVVFDPLDLPHLNNMVLQMRELVAKSLEAPVRNRVTFRRKS